jgi:hypothetical protein
VSEKGDQGGWGLALGVLVSWLKRIDQRISGRNLSLKDKPLDLTLNGKRDKNVRNLRD